MANIKALIKVKRPRLKEKPATDIPNAVAAAGGCSVSVTTMSKTARDTAKAWIYGIWIISIVVNEKNINPERIPIKCPPTTFLNFAVLLFGIANTINAVAPKAAIITD